VSAGEWEVGEFVIEGSGFPGIGCMTLSTVVIELVFDVAGIGGCLKIGFVTINTVSRSGLVALVVT